MITACSTEASTCEALAHTIQQGRVFSIAAWYQILKSQIISCLRPL